MRMAVQTVIWWGVVAAVLPYMKGSNVDLNSNLKKRARLRALQHSRTLREPCSSSLSSQTDSGTLIGPQHRTETEPGKLCSSFRPVVRSRRSTVTSSKRPGCALSTCALHELVHLLNAFNNRSKVVNAPQDKISPQGYGRRRRRRSPPERYAKLTLLRGPPARGVRGEASPVRVA